MTPNDPHLIQFFLELKKSGLPLQIEDYELWQKALMQESLRPKNSHELKELCQLLWGKSQEEKKQIATAFDEQLIPKLAQEISEIATKPASNNASNFPEPSAQNLPSKTQLKKVPLEHNLTEESAEIQVGIAVPALATTERTTPSPKYILNDEYFPLTRTQLAKGWRFLRESWRSGNETELDINATIKRICQENIAEFVWRQVPENKSELLLLIDKSNSMIPFDLMAEQLKETAALEGIFQSLKVFYFRNSPKDALFADPELLERHPLDTIIPQLHLTQTRVLIFSDAGATRPIISQVRIELIENFLSKLQNFVRSIVWLNPLPKEDWLGTTASEIYDRIPMFSFSVLGWGELLLMLRGHPFTKTNLSELPLVPEIPEISLDEKSWEALDQVLEGERGNEQYEDAIKKIDDFAHGFPEYLNLAYHASFPLAFSPHLLYYLRDNFLSDLPGIAIPDLLLSGLCESIGGKLYQMDSTIRHLLLKTLKIRWGKERLNQLSDALLFYLQQALTESGAEATDLGENPKWIALAYTEVNELATQLTLKLQQSFAGTNEDKIKTASLVATFAEPLAEANFQPLLTLGQGLARQGRGYKQGAQEIFDQFEPEFKIAGVQLKNPGRHWLPIFTFETLTVNKKGEITHRETKEAQYFTEDLGNDITLEMVDIPGGLFTMGSPDGEGNDNEKPQHQVTIKPFSMGKYPVTQAQWKAVANLPKITRDIDPDPSHFKGENRPVETVSWDDAVEFCARLAQKTRRNYRLPSEAEWEYACRAGVTTPFHFVETITSDLANYQAQDVKMGETLYKGTYAEEPQGEYRKETTPVGSFPPNAFGLYDMHGNVREWCADPWHDSYKEAPTDGTVWDKNDSDNVLQKIVESFVNPKKDERHRLLRGGSWYYIPRNCRSAVRFHLMPGRSDFCSGFRLVCATALT